MPWKGQNSTCEWPAGMVVAIIMRTDLQRETLPSWPGAEAAGKSSPERTARSATLPGDERTVQGHQTKVRPTDRGVTKRRLENAYVKLEPLAAGDFEALYAVASDPLIWEQHPNKNRYQREAFATYFQGAIESRQAVRIIDAASTAH